MLGIFDPNIQWHVPGRSPLSGDYKGHDEVIAFFSKTRELSGGTFSIEINEDARQWPAGGGAVRRVCAAARPALVITGGPCLARGQRNGQAVEFREYQDQEQTEQSSGPSSCAHRVDLQAVHRQGSANRAGGWESS